MKSLHLKYVAPNLLLTISLISFSACVPQITDVPKDSHISLNLSQSQESINAHWWEDFHNPALLYLLEHAREFNTQNKLAKTHIEKTKTKDIIVIDEIPYQVNKARLVEQIAELAKEKVIEGISEVRDESDREGIRVVIELKREAMSEIVLNHLFKSTPMESTFGIILLAIYNKEPKIFTLLV